MKIIHELKKYSNHHNLSIILRHASREPIPIGEFGNEVLINEKGIADSIRFGEQLKKYELNKIFSSPIQRCIQTAECIAEGYQRSIEIIATKALGDPGLHVTDETVAGRFYIEHGMGEMYQRFINGTNIPGMTTPDIYYERMNDFIRENVKGKGITLFITHDSLIAFYHYCLNKTVYTTENWVPYLGGIILNGFE